ncbi:hypothetical protein ACHAW6_014892 [Cyclotella cf. meneghiniana]
MLERLKELCVSANRSLEDDVPVYGGSWMLRKLEEEVEKKKRKEEECPCMENDEGGGLYL